ncbi:hypothetical protein Tco_0115774 [Tanacetum coccineum]
MKITLFKYVHIAFLGMPSVLPYQRVGKYVSPKERVSFGMPLECHQYSPDEHVGNLLLQRECCIFSNGEYVKAGLAEIGICCRHAKKEVMLLSDLSVMYIYVGHLE